MFSCGNSFPFIKHFDLFFLLKLLTFHSEEGNDSHSMPCLQLHYKHLDNRGPQVRWENKMTKFLYNSLC